MKSETQDIDFEVKVLQDCIVMTLPNGHEDADPATIKRFSESVAALRPGMTPQQISIELNSAWRNSS